MATLARVGLFSLESFPLLRHAERPTFKSFLCDALKVDSKNITGILLGEDEIVEKLISLGHCQEHDAAVNAAKTIIFLGLNDQTEIPVSCKSAFDITCFRMEERMGYASGEQDMVLLHHEVEVEYPSRQHMEKHTATLLEFGRTKNGKSVTAMALTVGIPAAIGALLLLENKIKTRGVLRPIDPEVYIPALDILQAQGIKMTEKVE